MIFHDSSDVWYMWIFFPQTLREWVNSQLYKCPVKSLIESGCKNYFFPCLVWIYHLLLSRLYWFLFCPGQASWTDGVSLAEPYSSLETRLALSANFSKWNPYKLVSSKKCVNTQGRHYHDEKKAGALKGLVPESSSMNVTYGQ